MNLEQFNFSRLAARDFKAFSQGKKNQVLLLIFKQAQKGADFKSKGNGNQLNPPLHQFAKIKSNSVSLRVIYRPVLKEGFVEMQLIAIGPSDKDKVYNLAKRRIVSFLEEMNEREE